MIDIKSRGELTAINIVNAVAAAHVGVGLVVAVLAAVELWMLHQAPPRVTA